MSKTGVFVLRITYMDKTSRTVEFPTQHSATRAYNQIKKHLKESPDTEFVEIQVMGKPLLVRLRNYFTLGIEFADRVVEAATDAGSSPNSDEKNT